MCHVAAATAPPSEIHETKTGRAFLADISEKLKCAICLKISDNPHQCPAGHLFCYDCVFHWLSTHRTCPTCRCVLTKAKLSHSILASELTGELTVRCYQGDKAAGATDTDMCSWVGPLGSFETHCLVDCGNTAVTCPQKACGTLILRKDTAEHMQVCPGANVACDLCGERINRGWLETHKAGYCPKVPIECPEDCRKILPREDMKNHVNNDCPETKFSCPFNRFGCPATGLRRKDLAEHQAAAMAEHLALLPARMAQLEEENNRLANKNGTFSMKIQALEQGNEVFIKSLSWKTKVPTFVGQKLDSKTCEVGDYTVSLRAEIQFEGYLGLFVHVKDAHNRFPVLIEGTTLTVGDVTDTLEDGCHVSRSKNGRGWVRFIKLNAAHASAVDGAIAVSANVRITPPKEAPMEL